jgi:hypothetical protein
MKIGLEIVKVEIQSETVPKIFRIRSDCGFFCANIFCQSS